MAKSVEAIAIPRRPRACRCFAAALAGALLWPTVALGQASSSCMIFGPERAAELEWAARWTPAPIVDDVLAEALRVCFGKDPLMPIVQGDLHRLRILRHQGDHLHAIARLDGLELAVNLEELLLPDNQVVDLRPLAGLKALTTVALARNQVVDAAPLAAIAWQEPGAAVNLVGNPLGRGSLKEVLPGMTAHGVSLEFDRPDVLLFPSGDAEGLLRIINHSAHSGEVKILGFIGIGSGLVRFQLGAAAAVNFDTGDLTMGNLSKGISGRFAGIPHRMEFETDLDIEVLVYARNGDGLLTALHDDAPVRHRLPQFDTVNPGSTGDHVSAVRLVRMVRGPGDLLWLRAHDDAGARREVRVFLQTGVFGHEPNSFSAAELAEAGLGDGTSRWRIETLKAVQRGAAWAGWSLLESPSGQLSNLSSRPHRLEAPLFPRAGDPTTSCSANWCGFEATSFLSAEAPSREGFVRIANHSHAAGTVKIFAVDDAGGSREPLELALAARQTRHFNSRDLEAGNLEKGLSGGVGAGTGDWRLRFESNLDIKALTYVRHADGFVTSMHDVAPSGLGRHRVATFNPASGNRIVSRFDSQSLLRIVNVGTAAAEVAVSGTDDSGRAGAGTVRLVVPAGAATTLTASQLEQGGPDLSGQLGDGEGMWRLLVESAEPLRVMSLMGSISGRLTNISTAKRGPRGDSDGDGTPDYADVDDDNDGIADSRDALPFDPAESVDTDGDGIGNLADNDDDGDGVEDALDARPLDASGHEPLTVADLRRYRFVGEHRGDRAFQSIAVADVDCDGVREIIIGAPAHLGGEHHLSDDDPGAVYLASAADLPAADAADGQVDGIVYLGRIAAEPHSWKLIGDAAGEWVGASRQPHHLGTSVASVGDINGDGCADLLLGARARDAFSGSAYLVSALDLPAADGADAGGVDGVVNVRRLVEQPGSYEFLGERHRDVAGVAVAGVPDLDSDGFDEIAIGASWYSGTEDTGAYGDRRGAVYVLARRDLATMDAADGAVDGSIGLASIGETTRSRRIIGSPGDGLGYFLAVGEFDGDGRSDLVVGGVPGALYVFAAADISLLDAADGAENGTADLANAGLGDASWRLLGADGDTDEGIQWRISDLSTGDVDGDSLDDIVVSGGLGRYQNGGWAAGARFPSYVIPAAAMGAADRADGAADRVVRLELAAKQEGALVFDHEDESDRYRAFRSTVADIDGDGLGDVVFADDEAEPGGWCQEPRWHGAAWVMSGAYLSGLRATESAIVLAELEPDGVGLWKFVGAGGERLGYSKPLAASLDGEGSLDLILSSYGPLTYYRSCGSSVAPGTAVAISASDLEDADASDGRADGTIRFDSLWGGYDALINGSFQLATTQFDENIVLMEISGETNALLRYGVRTDNLASKLYETYQDAFDYLIIQANIPDARESYTCAWYETIGNAVAGTGVSMLDYRRFFGSARKLTGAVRIVDRRCLDYDTLAHEIMHTWANFILPSSGSGPHWGFTSANGVLGGFDRSKFVDLGDGRYAAGRFSDRIGSGRPYSPIELYLAGLLPADEVPALWVASDGRWTHEFDNQHGRIFTASQIEDWSAARIVEEFGPRTPTATDSQKEFRAAFVLITDAENPPEQEVLEELSALVRAFSNPANDADDETFNFHETTGGRATFATGNLTEWRKPHAVVPLAKSARAFKDRPFVASQRPRHFGGATKAGVHVHRDAGHMVHDPDSAKDFGRVDDPPPQTD